MIFSWDEMVDVVGPDSIYRSVQSTKPVEDRATEMGDTEAAAGEEGEDENIADDRTPIVKRIE